ncbi:unnamed protein product [Paramecium sonneborni]|uniref:Uncharacterized protein n=1 Tax=Paramecium sonneborni TaxID=65129 RepID=A0A8S1KUC7_9CILI|nr:unnamed protein product [Paramecium sonneborni]
MGQQCCRNSAIPDSEDNNNNLPEKYSNRKPQETTATANNSQSYQTRINELENNVQTSLEVMNKLNLTIKNLAVQIEELNKQLEEKQQLQQNDHKVEN